jgi:RNA polymerase sigma-70 factor (ECF subfamily)
MPAALDAPTDESLLARHRAGETGAFDLLYERHAAGLYAFALGLTHERHAAEDVVQDAFVRLLSSTSAVALVRPFLYAAARNRVRDEGRRSSVRRRARVPAPADARPAEDWALLEDLRRLEPEPRETLLLKAFGGFTFAEISALLGIPLSTAATRHQVAVETLERLWRAE